MLVWVIVVSVAAILLLVVVARIDVGRGAEGAGRASTRAR